MIDSGSRSRRVGPHGEDFGIRNAPNPHSPHPMLIRDSRSGQKLDVAGLNELTVLIDRSETELTEVAINSWSPGLDGPPHFHDRKEQNFLVTSGRGRVIIGIESFSAEPGVFFHVPAGVTHQTINLQKDQRLDYFLFNAFLASDKEGHASFADHISKVKETRRQQAVAQKAGSDDAATSPSASARGKRVVLKDCSGPRSVLLDRTESSRCEAVLFTCQPGERAAAEVDATKEQTLFVLEGSGRVAAEAGSWNMTAGHVAFVPRASGMEIVAGERGLRMVSFGAVVAR